MEIGFAKGSPNNLPVVNLSMIDEFYMENLDFLSAETRNVKSKRSTRESYGDNAIGYVQVKRDGARCTVKAKITPEHKVHGKYYLVEASINEEEAKIVSCQCTSCTASSGGCKHGIAFLFWLHRRSEEPSVTSTTCYWRAPSLSKAGKAIKHLDLAALVDRPIPKLKSKSETFFKSVVENIASPEASLLQFFQPVTNEACSVYQMLLKYNRDTDLDNRNAESFIDFMKQTMTDEACGAAERSSRQQKDCTEWFELRFGRITASKIYEASRCKTAEGSLTEVILGASTFAGTEATRRGQTLEPEVLKEIARLKKIQIKQSGLILNTNYPIFGASPDGISNDHVIEIKCPSKMETVRQYVENSVVKPKYHAQIQMQMFLAQKEKGLFCVASPTFEQNKQVETYEVTVQESVCDDLIRAATNFWKNAIYPLLNK